MNNKTKEAIERIKGFTECGDSALIENSDRRIFRIAMVALERLDKVKFATEEEIKLIWACPKVEDAIELAKELEIIESEKMCRWTDDCIETKYKMTRKELGTQYFVDDINDWHPVKEEE